MSSDHTVRPFVVPQWDDRPMHRAVTVTVAVAASAVTVACLTFGTDYVASVLAEVWPLTLAPAIGWFLGGWAVRSLYHPTGRVVASIDPVDHTARFVFIPDFMFTYFRQSGNNVLYHTPAGTPVYLAEVIDETEGIISYSWIHEHDPLVVMTREEAYSAWHSVLEQVMRENLAIMDHPHVIGIGYARRFLRDHLDEICRSLGITVPEYTTYPGESQPMGQMGPHDGSVFDPFPRDGGPDNADAGRHRVNIGPNRSDAGTDTKSEADTMSEVDP